MEVLRKRQRFTDHDDLVLLREVLSHNPFENPALWRIIQENMFSLTGKTFTVRTLKEHLERLIKLWLELFKNLKEKSGIEQEYTEKDNLCCNIYDMMREFKDIKKKKHTMATSKVMGLNARNGWTELLLKESADITNSIIEANINHDHGSLAAPLEEITIDFVQVDPNKNSHDDNEDIEDIEPKGNEVTTTAPVLTPSKNLNTFQLKQTPLASSSKPTKVFGPIRARKQKANTQRKGLEYLEQYDRQQADIKKKQLEIEEKKLILEERRMDLLEKQHALTEFQIKKQFEIMEKKYSFKVENQKKIVRYN